jgi:hypothetical protein
MLIVREAIRFSGKPLRMVGLGGTKKRENAQVSCCLMVHRHEFVTVRATPLDTLTGPAISNYL